MPWNEAQEAAGKVVKALEEFNKSSASLSEKMITLSRWIYWLTWGIFILTFVVAFLTVWLVFIKPSF